jgi:nitrite reductase/ring-hydroxylating ferredoxin subunit
MSRHVVAAARDIPPGGRKLVRVNGRDIVVFNIGGEFFGLLNRCPHQGGNLSQGTLIGLVESREPGDYRYSRPGEILRCPRHGWEFDVRTGQSWCEPARVRAMRYPVAVESGNNLAKGPYVAETFPVSVDEQYVVIEVPG